MYLLLNDRRKNARESPINSPPVSGNNFSLGSPYHENSQDSTGEEQSK